MTTEMHLSTNTVSGGTFRSKLRIQNSRPHFRCAGFSAHTASFKNCLMSCNDVCSVNHPFCAHGSDMVRSPTQSFPMVCILHRLANLGLVFLLTSAYTEFVGLDMLYCRLFLYAECKVPVYRFTESTIERFALIVYFALFLNITAAAKAY